MKGLLSAAILVFALCALPIHSMYAAIPAEYTNDNFWTSEHDKLSSFYIDSFGNFYGTTATGKSFSQINVEHTLSTRLQKFSIDSAYFYISDKGVIVAPTDIVALSIYLSRTV